MALFGKTQSEKSIKSLHDEDKKDKSSLFKEINNVRKGLPDVDQDEIDRAKLNDSIFGKLAKNKKFEYTTLAIIVLNAGFIGYDADFSARKEKSENLYDCEDLPPGDCYQFAIFENFFAVYFTFEVVVRFLAYKRKSMSFTDPWFVFDSTLVLFMVVETWILPIIGASGPLAQLSVLRLLRLLRITRMAKLMRFFPELQIIVKGMAAAVRSVACTAILLLLILYVWAILFTSEFHQGSIPDEDVAGTAQGLFGSMGKSMRHLFIMGTILDDITLCCNAIRDTRFNMGKGVTMLFAFIVFVLISSFTMLNMLIGILCEVVCATGEGERNKNMEAKIKESIDSVFKTMDKDQNGQISHDEFLSMRHDKSVMNALMSMDVTPKHFDMYAEMMFNPTKDGDEEKTLAKDDTVAMILRLRPGTKVSALDFASFQQKVLENQYRFKKHLGTIEKMTSMLTGQDLGASNSRAPSKGTAVESLGDPPTNTNKHACVDAATDQDILAELQRRLGRPSSPSKEAWSKETYTC